jgi:hypothetical protein
VGGAGGVEACWSELRALREGLGGGGGVQGARTGERRFVGLDCEWRHPRPISVVQVATAAKVLLLFLFSFFSFIFYFCGASRYRWQDERGYGCVCLCVLCVWRGGGGRRGMVGGGVWVCW